MKVFFDENLTPDLTSVCHSRGYEATCARDRGLLDTDDDVIRDWCFAHDHVLVTNNAQDFRWLLARVELHPGAIIIPQLARRRVKQLFERVLDYIEAQAGAGRQPPRDFMINTVVESDQHGNCEHTPLPPLE